MIRKTGLLLSKQVSKQFVRTSLEGGVPGETVPFKLGQKWRATIMFIAYFTVPWWAPYLVVAIQMNK